MIWKQIKYCILRFSFNSFWTKKIERLQENACVGNGWVDAWIVVVTWNLFWPFSVRYHFFLQAKLALLLWINHEIKKQDWLQLEECQPFFLIFGSLFDKICPPGWFTSIRHLFALYLGPCYMYKLPLPVLSNAP